MTGPAGAEAFLGDWQLAREIDDHLTGDSGSLAGLARITAMPDGFLYREDGQLSLPGRPPFTATRSYLWQANGAGRIDVFFDDGRPFHSFALTRGAQAAHFCDPDTYLVEYDFSRWPRWKTTWDVTGPRKGYRMISRYTPAA